MRAEATARLRLRVGAYEHHRRTFEHVERIVTALYGADERPRRVLVHATIVVMAAASALGAMLFGA